MFPEFSTNTPSTSASKLNYNPSSHKAYYSVQVLTDVIEGESFHGKLGGHIYAIKCSLDMEQDHVDGMTRTSISKLGVQDQK